jgi:hypothetical protein
LAEIGLPTRHNGEFLRGCRLDFIGIGNASATISLFAATESAVKANKGFLAISVLPMLSKGRPVAVVTLLGPDGFRVVAEKLYRFGF